MNTPHYFDKDPQSQSQPRQITIAWGDRMFTFWTDAGVFSRDALDKGTRTLLTALPEVLEGPVLDLGCGWGAMGVIIAATSPNARVTMADINPRAVALARRNADANHVRAEVLVSDGFAHITGRYRLIVCNPPIRAGKAAIYGLFRDCAAHLEATGALMIVIRKQQGAESALKYLGTLFGQVDVIEKSGGYWVIRSWGGQNHDLS